MILNLDIRFVFHYALKLSDHDEWLIPLILNFDIRFVFHYDLKLSDHDEDIRYMIHISI